MILRQWIHYVLTLTELIWYTPGQTESWKIYVMTYCDDNPLQGGVPRLSDSAWCEGKSTKYVDRYEYDFLAIFRDSSTLYSSCGEKEFDKSGPLVLGIYGNSTICNRSLR